MWYTHTLDFWLWELVLYPLILVQSLITMSFLWSLLKYPSKSYFENSVNLTLNHSFFFFFSFFLRWGFSLKLRQALSSVCNSGWIWNQSSLPASPSQDCKWWSQCAEVTSAFESILPLPSISVKHGNCCRLPPLFNVQKAFSCLYTDHLSH